MRHWRVLTSADMAWLPDVFVPHGIILPPVVRTMILQGRSVGGWWDTTFLGFGTFQVGFWPDVAELGLWLLPEASRRPLAAVRLMQDILAYWTEVYSIRRWQALVLTGWPEGQRLVELLGFDYEGTLQECEPGKDYAWYGRVRKEVRHGAISHCGGDGGGGGGQRGGADAAGQSASGAPAV